MIEREYGERENQQQRRASWSKGSRIISPSLCIPPLSLSLSLFLFSSLFLAFRPSLLSSRIRYRSICTIDHNHVYSRPNVRRYALTIDKGAPCNEKPLLGDNSSFRSGTAVALRHCSIYSALRRKQVRALQHDSSSSARVRVD